jgi:hypothetical protein
MATPAGPIASISRFSVLEETENREIRKIVFARFAIARICFGAKFCQQKFRISNCHKVARVGAAVGRMQLSPVRVCHQLLEHLPDLGHFLTALPRELEGQTAHAR